jgi:hypothetical protein
VLRIVLCARCDSAGSMLPLAAPPSTRLLPHDRFLSLSLLPCCCTSPSPVSTPPAAPHPHSHCGAAPSLATTECGEAARAGRRSRVGTNGEAVGAAQICTTRHHGSPPLPPAPYTATRHRRHLLRHPNWPPSRIASSTTRTDRQRRDSHRPPQSKDAFCGLRFDGMGSRAENR